MATDPIKILYVQDSASTTNSWPDMVDKLGREDFEVTTAKEQSILAGKVVARRFDVALLQNVGPLGAFTQLRTQRPGLPIIILADNNNEELALRSLQAGAQDFLVFNQTSATRLRQAIKFSIERKLAHSPIRESEERYRSMFKNARDVVYITNCDGKFVDINRTALQLFGYTRPEMIRMNIKNLFTNQDNYHNLEQVIAKKGAIKDYEVKLVRKDGTKMYCLLNLAARYAKDNSLLEYHGIIRDITHRRTLEETWRHYEFIVNNSKEFMTLMNRDYVYEAVNESYCRAHGKSRDGIVGKTVGQVWGEGVYLERIKETLDQCFAGEEVYFQGWLGFAALGERYMHVTYYPYHNADGLVTHIVVVSRDVTAQKQAEAALNEASARNEQLLASIPSILITVNSDDEITHLNKPAETVLGVSAKDVVGKPLLDCGIPWDWFELLPLIKEGRQGMKSTSLNDVKYTRLDGKECFLNITVNPFVGESNKQAGILIIGRDFTKRKILESQLSQAQKLESIEQLSAGVAHEINTPTQYVGDNIRFLQEAFTDMSDLLGHYDDLLAAAKANKVKPELITQIEEAQDDADVEFLVEEIPAAIEQSLEGVERVSGIVRAMKEFSHPGVEQKTAIDINKAIESTITVARNEWKYVAEMKTEFDTSLPPVPCLPSEFNQAILNMIINATHAIDDIPGDGNGTKGTITVQTRRDDTWVEISIADTGTGIPEAARSKIFDHFFTTKEVGKGTGQGLSIAHGVIVDKHGGTINFESETNKGTTFFIRLPLDPEASNGDSRAG